MKRGAKKGDRGALLRGRIGGDVLSSGIAVAALSLLAGFVSLPILSLLLWTFGNSAWEAMASPVALQALLLSMKTTAITMTIIILVGTPAAYALARFEFPGKKVVDTIVDIPAGPGTPPPGRPGRGPTAGC